MFGYNVTRGKVRKNAKETPFKTLRKGILIGSCLGVAIAGVANANEPYGAGTNLPYPLSVGDTFTYRGDDCLTLYSWHDDYSAVAGCHNTRTDNPYYIEHDGETDTWTAWGGLCIHVHRKHYRVAYVRVPVQCYGPSLVQREGGN